jgi:hypothetical protein
MSQDKQKPEDEITRTTPVDSHETFGGGERDAVAGGPSGRGNAEGATLDPGASWGRNENPNEAVRPVKGGETGENPFSK